MGSHERTSPSKKKKEISSASCLFVRSQSVVMANNRLWMGGGGGVGGEAGEGRRQAESLIACRLDVVDEWPDGEGRGIVGSPGGRAESAHRLKFPMVKVPMGSVGYGGTSTGLCSRSPGL
jgi:hypothetical protein